MQRLALSGICASKDPDFWEARMECNPANLNRLRSHISRSRKRRQHAHERIDRSAAVRTFEDLIELAKTCRVNFFLVSGTFLGAVRNGDFLGHDYDIDVGVRAESFDLEDFLTTITESNEFFLKSIECRLDWKEKAPNLEHARPAVVKLLHVSGVTVDVFIHYTHQDITEHGTGSHIWKNQNFSLMEYQFLGRKTLGPKDYDRYLTENYGNWRQEQKVFDCDFDTPNLQWANSPYTELYIREYFNCPDIP